LLVFTNKLSGGQKGEAIYHQLLRLLNPRQVFQLENDTTIKQALEIYSSLSNTRILVCGGDGSIGWMISILAERFTSLNNPPISICPLGTGNDLSRVLGWGRGYNTKRLLTTLMQIPNAQPIPLDRWQVDFEPLTKMNPFEESGNIRRCLSRILDHPKFVRETDRSSYKNYQKPLNVRFTNYISFGLDAAVVLDFHDKRMRNPSKFSSPFKNKLIYINTARQYFREFALWRAWNLRSYMRLICDGKDFTDSLRHCHTIVLLNIPSYGSGTRPWSRTYPDSDPILIPTQNQTNRFDKLQIEDPPDYNYNKCKSAREDISTEIKLTRESPNINQIGRQSMNDRKIEVLGLDSIQMALIHIGFRGRRIAQCSEVRIELIRSMPVHMDGDPFYLPQSTAVNVIHAGQVLVLRNDET
jgi:diacylglycerol kinase (ATP)